MSDNVEEEVTADEIAAAEKTTPVNQGTEGLK